MLPTPLTFGHGITGSVAVKVSGRRRDASEIISIALLSRVSHHPVFPEPNEAKSLGGKFNPDNGLKNLLQDGGTLSPTLPGKPSEHQRKRLRLNRHSNGRWN